MSCGMDKGAEGLENETLPHHSSFSNPASTLLTSQLILQPFFHYTYITAHSPTLLPLYLHHSSFYNPSSTLLTSQLTLIHLCHSSFSNPSLALPTSQLILQALRCFTYVTVHSPTLLSPLLRHRIFTYFTWRAAHISFVTEICFCFVLRVCI